ncbi:endosomal transmembrane epsin interactor 1 isoform X3 [Stegostoma tigrinum]|uniref:endosomal transmembrane epsin interactor 1 isoform X3 n=1 Tax=Stegostoma tigrinum TaxID=3053191 RepID=UPI00202B8944|nr:endosomal transmembrane epsin interactor 1 isoform X3 [Stegostoma tigrinum]
MSLPVLLPTSCCPVQATTPSGEAPLRNRARCVSWPGALHSSSSSSSNTSPARQPLHCPLYGRSLFALGLLQIALGFSIVSLSFGALSLTESPNVRNSCPFWAGSSVILSGILGLTTWKRPMLLLVKVIEGNSCFCCEDSQAVKCGEKKETLILYPVLSVSCDTVRLVLKDLLFAICVLNALTTTVCVVAAALQYLQIFVGRRPQTVEAQIPQEESEGARQLPDPDEFVPPIPPPPYFSTFCSYTPRINPRVLSNDVIPLTHIYATRMKGIEVFCPVEPPPPYEAVMSNPNDEQVSSLQAAAGMDGASERATCATSDDNNPPGGSVSDPLQLCIVHPPRSRTSETECSKSSRSGLRGSNSDPLLQELVIEELVVSCEAATQTDERPDVQVVTLRRGHGSGTPRSRPRSLVDYSSYRDTKLLVASFLEHSSCTMTPEVQELVENIRSVLQSDEEHMEEAVASANILDQAIIGSSEHNIMSRETPQTQGHARLLHLQSCGDLSTFTGTELELGDGSSEHKSHQERPHSLVGVMQETVL